MFKKKDGFCLQHPAYEHHPSCVTLLLHNVKLLRQTKNHTNSGQTLILESGGERVECNEETVYSLSQKFVLF